jgi:broad specificity phosphatase PhoE
VGDLLLLRHGETEWSRTGRHTGRTDVPLTPYGEQQARSVGRLLAGRRFALVLTSPLERAARTAALAGLTEPVVDPDLVEWDYGAYEGLTSEQIQARGNPGWRIFRDGVALRDPAEPGSSPGESLHDVATRVAAVLARVRPTLEATPADGGGDVALVGHGHALRILATVWLERPPEMGAQLVLGPASVSVLGHEHGVPAILGWNRAADDGPEPA